MSIITHHADLGRVGQRVQDLVRDMPLSRMQELYLRLGPDLQTAPELASVRSVLTELLNNSRPQRARRLFTQSFEPIWVNDGVLLHSPRGLPGLVLRRDVGVLWSVLSLSALAVLARTAQAALNELAQEVLIADALPMPEIQTLGIRMRGETVAYLTSALASATATEAALKKLSHRRQADSPMRAAHTGQALFSRSTLEFIRDYLVSFDSCAAALGSLARKALVDEPSSEDSQQDAVVLIEDSERMIQNLEPGVRNPAVRLLLPLAVLHARRQYQTVACVYREICSDGEAALTLSEALLGHFVACCTALTATLTQTLHFNRTPGAAVTLTNRARAEVDEVMNRLQWLLPALTFSGILEDKHSAPIFHNLCQDTNKLILSKLADIAADRANIAFTARHQAVIDHHDVLWLTGLIWRWYQLVNRHNLGDVMPFGKWRNRLMEDLRIAVDQAIRVDPGDTPDDCISHLLRLAGFAEVLDQSISQFLTVSSANLVHIFGNSLESSDPPQGALRTLIADFLDLVRTELTKSPRWQSTELTQLVLRAEHHGILGTARNAAILR